MTAPDGVDEELEALLRVSLTAAGTIAERLARAREDRLRAAAALSQRETGELGSRYDAERSVAAAQLQATQQERWWASSDPRQVADTWQVARQWRDDDPGMTALHDQYRADVQRRFGIDPAAAGGDPGAVAEELRRWADRQATDAQHDVAAAARQRTEAAALLAADRAGSDLGRAANSPDQGAGTDKPASDAAPGRRQEAAGRGDNRPELEDQLADSGVDWDSAERRMQLYRSTATGAGEEAATARVQAAQHQGTPPGAAVTGGKHPKVTKRRRPGRGAGISPEVSR